ncbi:MAG: histidine phosphatase family protein, partial [Lachnospiraceae bacterium]|nr:histidine phosphatase family protein [Lachnospiraceae bacterium]
EFDEEDIVLLVSHGATGHAILEYLKKTPRSAYWDVDINNCAVVELLLSTDGTGDDYRFLSNGFEKNW